MTARFHSYSVSAGHGLPHDPFKAIIAPRPIGWIASQSKQGQLIWRHTVFSMHLVTRRH